MGTSLCQFPSWAQGQWEQVKVDQHQLTFADLQSYKTYTVYCLDGGETGLEEGLVPVFAQSQW